MLAMAPTVTSARYRASDTSAATVSAAFLDAVTAQRWGDAASSLDLVRLDSSRKERVRAARFRPPPMTVEQLLRTNPGMPRAVAAYEAKQMAKERRSINYLRREFGVGDPDSLLALPIAALAQAAG
jgi:hypothetical protein